MSQPTLGLLEQLRPPSGFRTAAALGASYSVDLLACMAVMTTLDGADGEQMAYGRVEAYRALDRLRDKVRICYHAGRVSRRDGQKYPSLALLDRVVVPVRVPGHGSFHPKVWLVRQVGQAEEERFVLIVSSRNVTTSTDWDLGIAIDGRLGGSGVALPRVRDFLEHSLALAGEPARINTFGNLDDVRWTLPPHITEMSFDFQAGEDGPRRLHSEWTRFTSQPSRVLLLSPFIDDRMVVEASRRWSNVPTRRLVAGTEGLITVALGANHDALQALQPRQVIAASEAVRSLEAEFSDESVEELEDTRALHAKVIALDDGRHATLVLGSNNLTSSGWCGGSTEAFVRLVGDAALCEPLWEWSGSHAEYFDFPEPGTTPPTPSILERVQDQLHNVHFRLEERHGATSRLTVVDPVALELPPGVTLEVARYTTPKDVVPFPVGASVVELPTCARALRTRFVVCVLHHEGEMSAWIAAAELDPPIDDERDRELVARLLGLREFLAYLHSLGSDESVSGSLEGDAADDQAGRSKSNDLTRLVDNVHLEGLLRRLVSEPDAFEEMDRATMRYGELIRKGKLSSEEVSMLDRFLNAWSAISEAFRP